MAAIKDCVTASTACRRTTPSNRTATRRPLACCIGVHQGRQQRPHVEAGVGSGRPALRPPRSPRAPITQWEGMTMTEGKRSSLMTEWIEHGRDH